MTLELLLLKEQLENLLHTEAEITEMKPATLLTFANPYGGKPLQVLFEPAEDIKVTLNKTPRYYQQDSRERLLADVKNYAEGKTVSLDFTDNRGNESTIDRIAKITDVGELALDSLIELVIRINLLHSDELKDLLAGGGTINVHFWIPAKDFRYRQIGQTLKRI